MIKGQEIIEELGFKLPELELVEDGALEIFFVDNYGMIHGRFGWEAIRWRKDGISSTHPDNFNLVKVNWYDIPSNFPCLVKDAHHPHLIALKSQGDCIICTSTVIGKEKARPLTLEEVTKLIIKEGKC